MEPITASMIQVGLRELSNRTALGIDHWSPGELKGLSSQCLQAMADLSNHIEERGTWPRYILYNIVVLMGKLTGGTRPIALMPMLYRVWSKVGRTHIFR